MADARVVQAHIDIVNMALQKLGHRAIADFDDDTAIKAAAAARGSYDTYLKATMEVIPWDFCTVFKKLTAITLPADTWGYAAAFELPGGTLRPYAVEGQQLTDGGQWVRRANKIFTNLAGEDGEINTQLIMFVNDVGLYSPTFIDAVASRCAAEWSGSLVRVSSEVTRLTAESDRKMRIAASSDGGVGSTRQQEVHASVVTVRGRGHRSASKFV